MLLQVGHFAADAHGAEGSFAADVGVAGGEDGLDFGEEVARHFHAGDVAERAEGEADDVLVAVVQVAVDVSWVSTASLSLSLDCGVKWGVE